MGTKPEPAGKPEKKVRKAPVRKSPALKDYPNKLAWLKAMTEYEEAQATVTNEHRIIRIDKRIAVKEKAIEKMAAECDALWDERALLDPEGTAEALGTAQAEALAEAGPVAFGGVDPTEADATEAEPSMAQA